MVHRRSQKIQKWTCPLEWGQPWKMEGWTLMTDRPPVPQRASSLDSRRCSEKQPGTGLIFWQARPPRPKKMGMPSNLGCEVEVCLWITGTAGLVEWEGRAAPCSLGHILMLNINNGKKVTTRGNRMRSKVDVQTQEWERSLVTEIQEEPEEQRFWHEVSQPWLRYAAPTQVWVQSVSEASVVAVWVWVRGYRVFGA